ncbi:MAG: hypothetical protein HYY76_14915 [Acidobacteria bacterium]|nr:hypothetical protein [Acidobacteriota bacterium]
MSERTAATASPGGGGYGWVPAVAIGAAGFAFRFLSYTGFPNDHFVYVARAQQMLLGAWPTRDFVDPGFLLMYVASAAGLIVFGHNLLGEASIVFGGFAAAAALSYPLARAAAGSASVALSAVALQALAYPRSYSYPKLFLAAGQVVFDSVYYSSPEEQELMLSRLRREQVPVIALPDDNAAHFRENFRRVAAYIEANDVRAGNIDLPGNRRGDVLLDRRRAAVGVHAPLGWPCFARAD